MITQSVIDYQTLTGYTPPEDSKRPKDLLEKDVFLDLLMTQLQHQDPLNPMSNQEFLSQLAALSTVEELRKSNEHLQSLQLYQASINNAQSVSMIGKEVKARGDVIHLSEAEEVDIHFSLSGEAAKVEITIFDESGKVVKTISAGKMDDGDHTTTWNGMDHNGSPLADGDYTFEVRATDKFGEDLLIETFILGRVTGVSFSAGVPELMINGQKIMLGDVYEVLN